VPSRAPSKTAARAARSSPWRELRALSETNWRDILPPEHHDRLRAWRDMFPASRRPSANSEGLLTPRELEVLERIAAGDSNKLIARALDLSLHTVKRHVANILGKLGVETRGQAAGAWAKLRRG
jgi:LuxR family transcriptional regulator, maltose regulon positive regulatory protein